MTRALFLRQRKRAVGVTAGLAMLALPGCLERQIRVTSTPPGAIVWLNDRELGRTPVETSFRFYGDYDLRLELAGHEPLHTMRTATAPLYDRPGIDLLAAAVPARFRTTIEWHFELEPSLEVALDRATLEAELLERARAMAEQTTPSESLESEPR